MPTAPTVKEVNPSAPELATKPPESGARQFVVSALPADQLGYAQRV